MKTADMYNRRGYQSAGRKLEKVQCDRQRWVGYYCLRCNECRLYLLAADVGRGIMPIRIRWSRSWHPRLISACVYIGFRVTPMFSLFVPFAEVFCIVDISYTPPTHPPTTTTTRSPNASPGLRNTCENCWTLRVSDRDSDGDQKLRFQLLSTHFNDPSCHIQSHLSCSGPWYVLN